MLDYTLYAVKNPLTPNHITIGCTCSLEGRLDLLSSNYPEDFKVLHTLTGLTCIEAPDVERLVCKLYEPFLVQNRKSMFKNVPTDKYCIESVLNICWGIVNNKATVYEGFLVKGMSAIEYAVYYFLKMLSVFHEKDFDDEQAKHLTKFLSVKPVDRIVEALLLPNPYLSNPTLVCDVQRNNV